MTEWHEMVKEEATVDDLNPDKKPDLMLLQHRSQQGKVLEMIGVEQVDSIMRSDTIGSMWVNVENGEYSEVWVCNHSTPHIRHTVYRLV